MLKPREGRSLRPRRVGLPIGDESTARAVFGMAFALKLPDFVDRPVVVATFPSLEAECGLSDTQLGALVSVVSVTTALGGLPVALTADRWSRVRAISP